METVEKIDKALDLLLSLLVIVQEIAQISDEELDERKKSAERKTDNLLDQLR